MDKLKLVKFDNVGLVLGLNPFPILRPPPPPVGSKNDARLKSGQNCLKINHLALLI